MKANKWVVALVVLLGGVMFAAAQSDVAAIVSGVTTTFDAVAALCVSMGLFFIGYRIAQKIR